MPQRVNPTRIEENHSDSTQLELGKKQWMARQRRQRRRSHVCKLFGCGPMRLLRVQSHIFIVVEIAKHELSRIIILMLKF